MFKDLEEHLTGSTPFSRLCSVDTKRARKLLGEVVENYQKVLESPGTSVTIPKSWFAETMSALLEGYDTLLKLLDAVSNPEDRDTGKLEMAARRYLSPQSFGVMDRVYFRPEFEYSAGLPASHPLIVLSMDPRDLSTHNPNANQDMDVLCGTFLHGNFRVLLLDRRWLVRENPTFVEVSNNTPQ